MIHAGRELAVRLERAAAALGHDAVQAHRALFSHSAAEALPCGSGVAVFLNEDSPLTQIRGAGLDDLDLDAIEQFFADRVAPVTFTLTPFTLDVLWTQLSRREYEFGSFENVLVRRVTAADIAHDPGVSLVENSEEWAAMMAEAFFGTATIMGLDLARTLQAIPTCRSLIVKAADSPAAGAQIDIREGLGIFQCDGTLPPFRGLGLQTKLIRARLSMAAEAGCDLVTADTAPGSQSQRNYERFGFQVAYTKTTLIKPCF